MLLSDGADPSGLHSFSTNVSWLSPFALVPLQTKSMPCPMSGYGLAPGNVTPEMSMPSPWSSYSEKICGEK